MASLTELANLFGTDKGTQNGLAHGYSVVYDMLFAPLRTRPSIRILEMGLAIGGPELDGHPDRVVVGAPSIDTWLQYFDDAEIFGFDISDFSRIDHDRFTFVRGDSGNSNDLERLIEHGPYDVIIDDASHASYHQQLALATLFVTLKPGGLYIIEDLSWQPASFESALPSVPRTGKVLADLFTRGHYGRTAATSDEQAAGIEKRLSGLLIFEESSLNAMRDGYNLRQGLPRVDTDGWRGRRGLHRVTSPYFWLFNARRLRQAMTAAEGVNWQSAKLAVLQRTPNHLL